MSRQILPSAYAKAKCKDRRLFDVGRSQLELNRVEFELEVEVNFMAMAMAITDSAHCHGHGHGHGNAGRLAEKLFSGAY